MSFNVHLAHSV